MSADCEPCSALWRAFGASAAAAHARSRVRQLSAVGFAAVRRDRRSDVRRHSDGTTGARRHPRRHAIQNGAGYAVDDKSGHVSIDCVADAGRRSSRRLQLRADRSRCAYIRHHRIDRPMPPAIRGTAAAISGPPIGTSLFAVARRLTAIPDFDFSAENAAENKIAGRLRSAEPAAAGGPDHSCSQIKLTTSAAWKECGRAGSQSEGNIACNADRYCSGAKGSKRRLPFVPNQFDFDAETYVNSPRRGPSAAKAWMRRPQFGQR